MSKLPVFYYGEVESPVGLITIVASDEGICRIDFGNKEQLSSKHMTWKKRYGLDIEMIQDQSKISKAKRELAEYFVGTRENFTVDFHYFGTPFQQKVWKALYDHIPYGKTKSYKEIAHAIGSPKAVRAVGGAVNKNPLSIIVPCHRVIGTDGTLVGYAGGLNTKKHLLKLEKAPVDLSL